MFAQLQVIERIFNNCEEDVRRLSWIRIKTTISNEYTNKTPSSNILWKNQPSQNRCCYIHDIEINKFLKTLKCKRSQLPLRLLCWITFFVLNLIAKMHLYQKISRRWSWKTEKKLQAISNICLHTRINCIMSRSTYTNWLNKRIAQLQSYECFRLWHK